jgi:RNA polymerase sigma-70 factor (ECF subfamily)
MAEHADKKLVARLLKGDRRSFDAFFNGYFLRLYRFALVRLDYDHDLAEETAQEVLCQAISKMATYRGEASLYAWMCTFCRHEISKQWKASRRARGDTALREDDPEIQAALESLLSAASYNPDVALYQSEVSRLVKVALDNVPALYADTLESKYVHGMSVREIAKRIGRSSKAVESILSRAREAFRDSFRTLIHEEQRSSVIE